MKFDGIDGECTTKGFEKWIEVDSYSWGVSNPGTGRAQFQDLHFSCHEMKPAPDLMYFCASGMHIPQVILKSTSPQDGHQYLTVTMKEVLISSYMSGGSGGSTQPPDSEVSISFGFIDYRTFSQRGDGSTGAQHRYWNIDDNTGG
jgi:type VI secretion system secreted protein Hcp